jgi:hypothetical protein
MPGRNCARSISRVVATLIALTITVPSSVLNAQVVTATLTGTVTDASGATVPAARVTAAEVSTGVSRSAETSSDGVYRIPFLNPGTYTVTIEKTGFKKVSQENYVLGVSTVGRVDAALVPGSMQETVEVTAEAPLLQSESAEVARNFDTKSVTDLPIPDRSVQAMAGLVAGVNLPVRYGGTMEDGQHTYLFNANGQPLAANNTMVDGVDNINFSLGLSIYEPSAEVVEEAHVTTNSYSAEFGRVGGAVVNIVTRGGTNQFHGAFWEFNKVADYVARDFFNKDTQAKPGLTYNDFGVSSGGPIIHDKTFFFGSYEGKTQRQASTSIGTVPQAAWLNGDFSAVPGLLLYDPNTGNADGTGRTPIPGNVIPASELSPVAKKLSAFFPAPNQPGLLNNYVTQIPFTYNANIYDVRVDHNLSSATKVYAKFSTQWFSLSQGDTLGPAGSPQAAHDYTLTGSVNLTHSFSPSLVTEVRVAYNRWHDNVQTTNPIKNSQLGIFDPNPDQISTQSMAQLIVGGLPAIGSGVGAPVIEADNIFPVVNTWSKFINRHAIKWGGEATRYRNDRFQPQGLNFGARGAFWFNPDTTQLNLGNGGASALGPFGSVANSIASYVLGTPDQTGRTYMTITPTTRQTHYAGFFQDSWKVTPKLTLELGVRYEYYTCVKPRYAGGASNYDISTNSLLVAGVGQVDLCTGVHAKPTYFAPRIGAAYTLGGKTVVRAGYAISYWEERFGFTGGTLNTQYPVIYNVQLGTQNDYRVDGTLNSIPAVPFVPIPSSGIITPAPNQAFYNMPRDYTLPAVYNYNFFVQRQVTGSLSFDMGYVGNVGRHLAYADQINVGRPGSGPNGQLLYQQFGRTANTIIRAYGINSSYNSFQMNVSKRYTKGLSGTFAYAFSKSLDETGENGGFLDTLNFKRTYGPSSWDQTHLLTVSHVYELPFGKGKQFLNSGGVIGSIVGQWQVNGVFRRFTGLPFTPTAAVTPCNCPGVTGIYADVAGSPQYPHGIGPGQPWVSTSAFNSPAPNTFGNAGRDVLRGPGLTNYDFSLFRNFRFKERIKLEMRAETTNLTNTPHFANPATSINSATFGIVSATGYNGNRQMQLGLRLSY